jgi:hypothetical protein
MPFCTCIRRVEMGIILSQHDAATVILNQSWANGSCTAHRLVVCTAQTPAVGLVASQEVAMKDLSIQLTHSPGEMADVTNALSFHGVNIKTVAAMVLGDRALLRIIPDDFESAKNALQERNIDFEESEVVTVLLENRAGELTGVAAKLADGGLNLEAVYVVGLADDLIELALVCDNAKKARKVLGDQVS